MYYRLFVLIILSGILLFNTGCSDKKSETTVTNKQETNEASRVDIEKELQKSYKEVKLFQEQAKSKNDFNKLASKYLTLLKNYSQAKNHEVLAACHYELALVYVKNLKDRKKAVDNLKIIVKTYGNTSWVKKAKKGISKLSSAEPEEKEESTVQFKDRYRNKDYRFLLKVPENWNYTDETGNPAIIVFMASEKGFQKNQLAYPNVNVICQRLEDEEISVAEYVNFFVEEELASISGYEKGESEIIKLKNNDAYSKIHTVLREDINQKIKQNQIYCIKRRYLYIITFSDLENDFNKNIDIFKAILDNFDFM